jgi:ubiquinone biosynthesis protein
VRPAPLGHPGLLTRIRNLERIREVSEVAFRHGFGYFFERHHFLPTFRHWRKRNPPPVGQRGRHIREMFDELGPTFVKFGQLLSTRPDIVPADIVLELVKLQDQVTPLAFTVVSEVIRQELGDLPERVFESIEVEPLAAASIGQVHGAVLPGGERVVVKVQWTSVSRRARL